MRELTTLTRGALLLTAIAFGACDDDDSSSNGTQTGSSTSMNGTAGSASSTTSGSGDTRTGATPGNAGRAAGGAGSSATSSASGGTGGMTARGGNRAEGGGGATSSSGTAAGGSGGANSTATSAGGAGGTGGSTSGGAGGTSATAGAGGSATGGAGGAVNGGSGGAANGGAGGASNTAGAGGATAAGAGGSANTAGAGGSGVQMVTLTDAQIASVSLAANTGEVDQNTVGVARARNPQVRDFAQDMVTMHTAAIARETALAAAAMIIPADNEVTDTLQAMSRQIVANLQTSDGDEFDQMFINGQVQVHQQVLALINDTLLPQVDSEPLRNELRSMQTTVSQHLETARRLAASLGGTNSMP